MKEPDLDNPDCPYMRRPQDSSVNIRSTKANSDTDVNLLVACKVQLSSEVIRWKTESLRLQKEKDAAQQRIRELEHNVARCSERSRTLEDRLRIVEGENRQFKTRSLALDNENVALMQQLSQSLEKYHSFPWAEGAPPKDSSASSSKEGTPQHRKAEKKSKDLEPEDWREISQRMMQQMKQEMKELQEMSFPFDPSDPVESESVEDDERKQELEVCLSSLTAETGTLKKQMLLQRQKMESLMNEFESGSYKKPEETVSSELPNPSDGSSEAIPNNFNPTFQDCFTRNLGGSYDFDRMAREVQIILKPDEDNAHDLSMQDTMLENERICPICQEQFDPSIPQEVFENHVFEHLEAESATLLEQYVVL